MVPTPWRLCGAGGFFFGFRGWRGLWLFGGDVLGVPPPSGGVAGWDEVPSAGCAWVRAFHSLLHRGESNRARGGRPYWNFGERKFTATMPHLRIVDTSCIPEGMSEPILSAEEMAKDKVAFPHLGGEEIAAARKIGQPETFPDGAWIFEADQRRVDFFVIVSGAVDILATVDGEPKLLVRHMAGGFLGNIAVFTQRPSDVSARAHGTTQVIRLSVAEMRRLAITSAGLGEKWMEAILRRHELVTAQGVEGPAHPGRAFLPGDAGVARIFFPQRAAAPLDRHG